MQTNSIIVQTDIPHNYSASADYHEGRSSSMGQKSGKSSILSHYHDIHSQQRESSKSSIKSKQLQNSQTINWLKKRYMDKAKDDYMLNQDENHSESKEIMGIYKDLSNNNTRNVSTEIVSSDRKKLQVEDVCGYLQKNDVNISKKQLADLLKKKQQNQGEINLDDFQKIMMSQTLNDKFKKCLQSQDMQQQLANRQSMRQNTRQQTSSMQTSQQHLDSLSNYKVGSMLSFHENNTTIDYPTATKQAPAKVEFRNNQTIEAKSSQQQDNSLNYHIPKLPNQILSNPNNLQNNIHNSKNIPASKNIQNPIIQQQDDLSQPYMAKVTVQTENLQRQQNPKNQSLKNLMNNIHFQIKRQKILEQFEKMKVNSKAKTFDKYSMLENLLKLPQYQINKYKYSDSSHPTNSHIIPPNIQNMENSLSKNDVPLFLTQSGQLDQLQAIRQQQDSSSRSPKQRRNNVHSQNNNRLDMISHIKSDSKAGYRRRKYNDKENLYSPKDEEDMDYADSVNEDEEEYEMQMLVQRAKYKARQQFKNDIQKAKNSVINILNEDEVITKYKDHHRMSTQDELSSKKLNTLINNSMSSNSKINTNLGSGQKVNTNISLNRQIRTNSLVSSNSKLQNDISRVQTYNESYIQLLDENTNKNNYYKLKLNPTFTPNKYNQNTLNGGNTSTQESQNIDGITRTEEDRNRFNYYPQQNITSNQQLSQLPHISSINRATIESKDQLINGNQQYFDNHNNYHRNSNFNNSLDISYKNQNIRRKFVSVFSKIHNNNSNNNSNLANSNNKSYQFDNHLLSSLKNTAGQNVSQFEGSITRQINLSKEKDSFTNKANSGSKTQPKKNLVNINQANNKIQPLNRHNKSKNYSFSVFQQSSQLSQNTLDYADNHPDHYAPQISNKQQQRRYKNDSEQFFNNNNSQSYF